MCLYCVCMDAQKQCRLAKPRKTPTQKTKQDLRMRLCLERMDAQERRG